MSYRLGPLEWRVLEALWGRNRPASVRDLIDSFPDIAYTTLMTTLDRLHRKGLLDRDKAGRAFVYRARLSRAEFYSDAAARAVRTALAGGPAAAELLLSSLVDAVSEQDHALLDDLETLVRNRRTSGGDAS
ncbi:MAG TPA: BlaI/MecI/CopY family transcriptional regulator [Vicinamibacterales bacterium]|nr:BlaI/MecI/CopY family transcriptional regulator [Vicinamibacterales bacterium]